MFDVGGGELLLIFVVVLLLFGPKKIPEVMRSVGKGLRQFRQAQEDLKQQMRDLSADVEKMPAVAEHQRDVPTATVAPVVVATIDVPPDMSSEIEVRLPFEAENTSPIIIPKPAESTVSRNQQPVKKVFDDTAFD